MLMRMRKRQKGFTLIELLIVIAIIGIIAALLIPNFLDALQKAKQKRTVADERNTGTAMFSWLTDQLGAAAAGAGVTTVNIPGDYTTDALTTSTAISTILVPQYLQSVPDLDGWKQTYLYWLRTGTSVLQAHVMAIQSHGRGTPDATGAVTVEAFDPTDYNQDIIWADGFFVRWPQKTTS